MEKSKFLEISSVIGDYKSFLDKIFVNLEKAGFDEKEFKELDHICYRVETLERYEEMKNKLAEFSSAQSEVEISGRPILVCRLEDPLVYKDYKIYCLELPAPRAGASFKEGLEHAEFVINSTLPEFLEKHKNVEFNMNEYQKGINPGLIVEFDDCAVKFHTQSLLGIRGM